VTGGTISILGDGVPATVAGWFIGADAAAGLPSWMQGFEGGFIFSVIGALIAYVGVAMLVKPQRPIEATPV
jgi:hypothetical protein